MDKCLEMPTGRFQARSTNCAGGVSYFIGRAAFQQRMGARDPAAR
jgi:hypothetical protein